MDSEIYLLTKIIAENIFPPFYLPSKFFSWKFPFKSGVS